MLIIIPLPLYTLECSGLLHWEYSWPFASTCSLSADSTNQSILRWLKPRIRDLDVEVWLRDLSTLRFLNPQGFLELTLEVPRGGCIGSFVTGTIRLVYTRWTWGMAQCSSVGCNKGSLDTKSSAWERGRKPPGSSSVDSE